MTYNAHDLTNAITPHGVRKAWEHQILHTNLAQDTPLTLAFFHPRNVEHIRLNIEARLQKLLQDPHIRFILTQEFALDMVETAYKNQLWGWDPAQGLPRLNKYIIDRETEIAMVGERHRAMFHTRYLRGERMRVFPYGMGEKTMHVRGERPITFSPYMLNHPWGKQHKQYLKEVLHIDENGHNTC